MAKIRKGAVDKDIKSMSDSEKLDLLLMQVGGINEEVTGLKKEVSELKEDVSVLKEDVSALKEDVSELKEDVSELKEDVSVLKFEMFEVKQTVQKMDTTIEQELLPKIKLVAENHLDLSRKLSDVLALKQEQEVLSVKNLALEMRVDKIEKKIS